MRPPARRPSRRAPGLRRADRRRLVAGGRARRTWRLAATRALARLGAPVRSVRSGHRKIAAAGRRHQGLEHRAAPQRASAELLGDEASHQRLRLVARSGVGEVERRHVEQRPPADLDTVVARDAVGVDVVLGDRVRASGALGDREAAVARRRAPLHRPGRGRAAPPARSPGESGSAARTRSPGRPARSARGRAARRSSRGAAARTCGAPSRCRRRTRARPASRARARSARTAPAAAGPCRAA